MSLKRTILYLLLCLMAALAHIPACSLAIDATLHDLSSGMNDGHAQGTVDTRSGISIPSQERVYDTGFRPDVNGFSFENPQDKEKFFGWDLNAITGIQQRDEILRHTGHCYGMSFMSVRYFMEGINASGLTEEMAMPDIDRVQTEQTFYYIIDFFKLPVGEKRADNRIEYSKVRDKISSGTPAILGIYTSRKDHDGHAVIAYRIVERYNRSYIYLYDPNIPAESYSITQAGPWAAIAVYDLDSGSFAYDNGEQYDELKLDDIDWQGVMGGKLLVASSSLWILGLVAAMISIRIRR